MKRNAFKKPAKNFLIRLTDGQNGTWQGTITLIDKKATQMTRFSQRADTVPHGNGSNSVASDRETFPFRSVIEMLRLIESGLADDEQCVREADR